MPDTPVGELGLSPSTEAGLRRVFPDLSQATARDLAGVGAAALLRLPYIGQRSLVDVRASLRDRGLTLALAPMVDARAVLAWLERRG